MLQAWGGGGAGPVVRGCWRGARRLRGGREAVARRLPEEPPITRMALFLRDARAEGSTVKVVILGFCVRVCAT